ncbi:hypothetical protein X975_06139, partial [Stegodyphus mimosarum]
MLWPCADHCEINRILRQFEEFPVWCFSRRCPTNRTVIL